MLHITKMLRCLRGFENENYLSLHLQDEPFIMTVVMRLYCYHYLGPAPSECSGAMDQSKVLEIVIILFSVNHTHDIAFMIILIYRVWPRSELFCTVNDTDFVMLMECNDGYLFCI